MKRTVINLAMGIAMFVCLISCSSSEDPAPAKDKGKYALFTFVQGGSHNFNYYLQPIKSLNGAKSYDNKSAVEIVTETTAGIYEFDGDFYTNTYAAPQKIKKWSYDESGNRFTDRGEITTTEVGYAGMPCFKDKSTAFLGGPSIQKILIFNPTTMKKTGAIDFSKFSKRGKVTNYPKAGDKVNIEIPTEMIIRDNYLFISFFLMKQVEPYTPATLTADMLVVDLNKINNTSSDNSGAIVKWISSDKGVSLGGFNSGFGAKFMLVDEKKDLYVLCHNFWGGVKTGKPSCVLRIKNGETDFDPDYYFDLESASRGKGNPVVNLEYAGNGIFFGSSNDPKAINPKDPLSYYQDPIAQWYQFNLYTKTGKKVSDEYTRGSLNAITYTENGKTYIPYQNKKEAHIKEVDIATLENKKLFTTAGASIIKKMK